MRTPPKVYVTAADIARLQTLITQLPGNTHVSVVLGDGTRYTGFVTIRPSIETFVDADGVEGMNAELRMDDPNVPTWEPSLWVGDIARVQALPAW